MGLRESVRVYSSCIDVESAVNVPASSISFIGINKYIQGVLKKTRNHPAPEKDVKSVSSVPASSISFIGLSLSTTPSKKRWRFIFFPRGV